MANPWDVLRPFDQMALESLGAIAVIGLVFSIIIFAISIAAYKKSKSRKLLFVSGAFFLFMLKWLILTVDTVVSPGFFFSLPSQALAEILIMLLLLLALFKK